MRNPDFIFYCILIAIAMGIGVICKYTNSNTQEHTILSIDKVEKTKSTSDGFTTELYYMVTTNRGAYKIVTSGFNASPQCAGIQKDSTYILTTRGINIPFFDMYPNIIRVQKK